MSKKQRIIEMDYLRFILFMLLISLPLLVILLHSILESMSFGMVEYDFFGINISLSFVYYVVLCLIISIPVICILLFLIEETNEQTEEED